MFSPPPGQPSPQCKSRRRMSRTGALLPCSPQTVYMRCGTIVRTPHIVSTPQYHCRMDRDTRGRKILVPPAVKLSYVFLSLVLCCVPPLSLQASSCLHWSHAALSRAGKSRLLITRRSLRVKSPTTHCHTCFMQLKKPTSSGCRRCVVCGGNLSMVMPFSVASCRTSYPMWDECPSNKSRTGRSRGREGMKRLRSQSVNASVVIQPLCDTANRVPRGPPNVMYARSLSPL